MSTTEINQLQQAKAEVYNYRKAILGDGMIDVGLDMFGNAV
jgi:hypothetical protein